MGLFMYGGDGKGSSVEAIQAAKQGDFERAKEKLAAAEESLLKARHARTEMLSQEAAGNHAEVSLLMTQGRTT